ncbi:hypothetical protein CDEST_01201 [Colletotrichum destructivum]|uniref:Uncharacterized protein n=1 Tax=Colletotrichum destructivum TaxID=34406 RepID=A0AAX4HZF2_9PEZI|nr:hypothetical protein CDEST_01201 [Colletotrichum destructivum]
MSPTTLTNIQDSKQPLSVRRQTVNELLPYATEAISALVRPIRGRLLLVRLQVNQNQTRRWQISG